MKQRSSEITILLPVFLYGLSPLKFDPIETLRFYVKPLNSEYRLSANNPINVGSSLQPNSIYQYLNNRIDSNGKVYFTFPQV